jgi:1,4-dihydroxy-6-naphthoate synthase
MITPLSLGYSPCPNDTFIFYALVHEKVDCEGLVFTTPELEDVETLNLWALDKRLDITKLSCHAMGYVLNDYCVLSAGSALGRGCGPLLVSTGAIDLQSLKNAKIAIPGRYTTAALLLQMLLPGCNELVEMRFDEILEATAKGEVDAGVIIHESRFTYQEYNLICLQDLGQWWEDQTSLPIPLGSIVARRSLGAEVIGKIDRVLQRSVRYAFDHPGDCMTYIRAHSQEMAKEVVTQHIGLYVNDYSLDLGKEGFGAIDEFLSRGKEAGVLPEANCGLKVR